MRAVGLCRRRSGPAQFWPRTGLPAQFLPAQFWYREYSAMSLTLRCLLLLSCFAWCIPADAGVDIRKGGSIVARVDDDGSVRVKGSIVGRFDSSGDIRVKGSIVGHIDSDGTIRRSGSIVGKVDARGDVRIRGSIVGRVDDGGDVRRSGSIIGSARGLSKPRAAALFFFDFISL